MSKTNCQRKAEFYHAHTYHSDAWLWQYKSHNGNTQSSEDAPATPATAASTLAQVILASLKTLSKYTSGFSANNRLREDQCHISGISYYQVRTILLAWCVRHSQFRKSSTCFDLEKGPLASLVSPGRRAFSFPERHKRLELFIAQIPPAYLVLLTSQ